MITNKQLLIMAIRNSELEVEWIDGVPHYKDLPFDPLAYHEDSRVLQRKLGIEIVKTKTSLWGQRSVGGTLVTTRANAITRDTSIEEQERCLIIEIAATESEHDRAREEARYLAGQIN